MSTSITETPIRVRGEPELYPPQPCITLILFASNTTSSPVIDERCDVHQCLYDRNPDNNRELCEVFKELRKSYSGDRIANEGCSIRVDPSDLWKIFKAFSIDRSQCPPDSKDPNNCIILLIHEICTYLISGKYDIILTYNQCEED